MKLATLIDAPAPSASQPRSERDSRVRLRAPEPEPQAEPDAEATDPTAIADTQPDFIAFLCRRFDLDRKGGIELLSQLVLSYQPQGQYRINTLDCENDREGIAC